VKPHIALTIALTICTACLAAPVRAQAPAGPGTGNPVNGKKFYDAYSCYGCHGFNGETGARILAGSGSPTLATESRFIAFLRARANLAPPQPSMTMPNYSAATLSDAQAKDIYAYVKSFKNNVPPADQIPVLNQILTGAQKPYKK